MMGVSGRDGGHMMLQKRTRVKKRRRESEGQIGKKKKEKKWIEKSSLKSKSNSNSNLKSKSKSNSKSKSISKGKGKGSRPAMRTPLWYGMERRERLIVCFFLSKWSENFFSDFRPLFRPFPMCQLESRVGTTTEKRGKSFGQKNPLIPLQPPPWAGSSRGCMTFWCPVTNKASILRKAWGN